MALERLKPRFLEKIWGAEKLEPWFISPGGRVGEVWFEGSAPSPLLIKFIFTSEDLSVQVHPEGKTEMWHILAAKPGARIAAGFREPMSAQSLRASAESGEIMDLLEWFPAAPGDTFFIPAGTVHAIGAGLVLCEIQQNCDITYRLYDYGRRRELHLDQGIAVSDLGRHAARQPSSDVSCSFFKTRLLRGPGKIASGSTIIAIEGSGEIRGEKVRGGEVWRMDDAAELAGDLAVLEVR